MKIDNILIETRPSNEDIDEIMIWLKRECEITGEGFYNNRGKIYDALQTNEVIVLKMEGINIGLVVCRGEDILVNIDIFVIDNKYRQHGYGSVLFNAISEFYIDEGFKVLKLFCEPKSSESFWKRMGFEKMPDCNYSQHELTYFKTIVDTASSAQVTGLDVIELWDVEPRLAVGNSSKWKWYVEIENGKLVNPIIQPCNCDWKLRLSRDGKVINEGKIKYFTEEDFELFIDRMLYIEYLF